jgi:hypothetical protein
MGAGLAPFNNYMAQATAMRTGLGFSSYNGLLVTLRKRLSRGLIFDLNYTFARSLDSGDNQLQNGATLMPNNFHLSTTYGPSTFDISHIFSGRWFYELPFHVSNVALNKLIGGWFLDSSLGKKIPFTEKISGQLAADFFNTFNNVNFLDPALSLTSPQTFGVITSQRFQPIEVMAVGQSN